MEVVGLRENVQAIRAAHPAAGHRDVLRLLESEYSWKAATTGQEQQVWRLLNELKSENENAYVGRMVAADSPVSEKNILPTRLRPRKAGGALQPVSLNAETEEADAAEDDDDDDDDARATTISWESVNVYAARVTPSRPSGVMKRILRNVSGYAGPTQKTLSDDDEDGKVGHA